MIARFGLLALAAVLLGTTGCLHEPLVSGQLPSDTDQAVATASQEVEITSGGQTYPAYFVAPKQAGRTPAVVLLHSINGLDPGYVTLSDRLAARGYAVLALKWQTFERIPHDDVVMQLALDGLQFLAAQPTVDAERVGLTGFCIGGRYTMLLLPQIAAFKSGVAWYGFPYRGGDENQVRTPAEVLDQLSAPMLILHGSAYQPSPIADIYRYATELDEAGKYFELKVYQGQPHSFMLDQGQMSQSFPAQDAFEQMATFFDRTL